MAQLLLPGLECCSEKEEDNKGKYHSIEIYWRSYQYSKFLHNLEKNRLNYTSEMKDKNKAKRSLEYERTYDGKKLDYELKPFESLPVN